MSRVTGKPPTSAWRRPITRMYDYNMALGENYYKPQLDYIASRRGRGKTPPSATTFAERLLTNPPSRRSASATRRAEETDFMAGSSLSSSAARAEGSMDRYASLDDLGLDEELTTRRRRQMLLQASQENLSADRGVSPALSGTSGTRHRVTFGDKVLDAVGVKEVASGSSKAQQISSLMTNEEGDVIDKILADRRNRRQAGLALTVKSAEADLFTEDPLKSPRISSRLQQARQQLDEMRDEMQRDADTSTSRFRQKLRAKREQERKEEEHEQLFGSLSALNDIGKTRISDNSRASAMSSLSSKNAASAASSSSSSSAVKLVSNISSSAQNLSSFVDDDDAETSAILNKVEQIRKRAKARLAQISDDFPDLQIESSLASRRAASRGGQGLFEDDYDSDLMPSSRLASNSSAASQGASSRSVTISKRSLKSSYDLD